MVATALDIKTWLSKIKTARSRDEVFTILDQFRPLAWTDEDRATMAKTYIRFLGLLGDTTSDAAPTAKTPKAETSAKSEAAQAAAQPSKPAPSALSEEAGDEPIDDGPVWYEKM